MSDLPCTFSAKAGPLYPAFQNITAQSGCCVTDTSGAVTTAYGLNNTCHILRYLGNAEPYRLVLLEQSAGQLTLDVGECTAMVLQIQAKGTYSVGDGTGPVDAGLASKCGYKKCVVGASANPDLASSQSSSAGSVAPLSMVKLVLLLAAIAPALIL
ncbi:hypothetical protein LTR53_003057 [Teratosphaeriaceae sp. CCFEE 6253]|nr:hypothetical protein LTR53_003057 [Teratosphaeriaceae sp. CCFEE 6253]